MTTVALPPASTPPAPTSRSSRPLRPPDRRPSRPARRVTLLPLRPGWPLTALLVLFPVWWALGLGAIICPILAVPMVVHLLRRRPIRLPPGFGIWMLFLLWVCAGALVLGAELEGTLEASVGNRVVGYATRLVFYLSATIAMLYAGNLTEKELPRSRLVVLLGVLFCWTVAGGLLGVLAPYFEFTSPFELLLPDSVRTNAHVQSLVHPASSQLQDVLGYEAPRPKAPFEYTNAWGNNLSILGLWFVVAIAARRGASRRVFGAAVLAVAVVVGVYSLNRGLWIGVGLSLVYVAVRLALRGRVAVLASIIAALALGAVLFAASPLQQIVQQRLDNPHSNGTRTTLSIAAVEAAATSPVIGYGTTRNAQGSRQSIAVGRSSDCQQCGNFAIGSNGQVWQLLISHGFVGTALYAAFLLSGVWRYRRDSTAIGIVGSLVLILALFYGLFYNASPSPLTFYLLSMALLWRNAQETQARPQVVGPRRRARRLPILAHAGTR